MVEIRKFIIADAEIIEQSFREQGWERSKEQYLNYFKEQEEEKRLVLIAEHEGNFAGYITLVWNSDYCVFKEQNIPEIMDFNVLEKYQKKGIGTELIKKAEDIAKAKSTIVGLRVGLLHSYGKAQRLYVKLGYIPDGKGMSKDNYFYDYFEKVEVDDDLAIGFTKKLI